MTDEWKGEFDNIALNALHAEGFDHPVAVDDWRGQVGGFGPTVAGVIDL